jgi:hypothetical protein
MSALLFACGTRNTDLVPLPRPSAAPPACAPIAAACVDDSSCCKAMPAVHCKPDGAGLASKHCQQDPPKMCTADGMPCAHAGECCGGYCLSGADGGLLSCSAKCRKSEEACATAADCCSDVPTCAAAEAGLVCGL